MTDTKLKIDTKMFSPLWNNKKKATEFLSSVHSFHTGMLITLILSSFAQSTSPLINPSFSHTAFIHSFVHSFVRTSFLIPLIHPCMESPVCLFTLFSLYSFIHPSIRSSKHPFISVFIHLLCPFIHHIHVRSV